MDVSPIVIDLETAPILNARDYIEAPDLSDVSAPSNYKDPEKIAAYIEKAKADKLANFERDCSDKGALDFNIARIVAMGWWTDATGTRTLVLADEQTEAAAISGLWASMKSRLIVGFRIREFDLPLMVQRSRYLGVEHPVPDLGRYARGNGICDLYDLLTFGDMRQETIMRRTAKSFTRRFGIPVNDPVDGKDIPALVAAGQWDLVESHVRSDVDLELALARRLGVIQPAMANAVGF